MSNYKHFIACISVEEKEALDYAKQNHLQFESCEQWLSTCVEPLEDKGISLLSSASVSGSDWGRYLAYLADWAMEHTDPRFDGMSPASYDEWLDMEETEHWATMDYEMVVHLEKRDDSDCCATVKCKCAFGYDPKQYGNGYFVQIVNKDSGEEIYNGDLRYDKSFHPKQKQDWLLRWCFRHWNDQFTPVHVSIAPFTLFFGQVDFLPIEHCIEPDAKTSLLGKVIAVDPNALSEDRCDPDHQFYVVTGTTNSGSVIYAKSVFDGKPIHLSSRQVYGEVKPEYIPEWVQRKMEKTGSRPFAGGLDMYGAINIPGKEC